MPDVPHRLISYCFMQSTIQTIPNISKLSFGKVILNVFTTGHGLPGRFGHYEAWPQEIHRDYLSDLEREIASAHDRRMTRVDYIDNKSERNMHYS